MSKKENNQEKKVLDGRQNASFERGPAPVEDACQENDLPEGFPERPDLARVASLREKLIRAKSKSRNSSGYLPARLAGKSGDQVRNLGMYSIIPMMMVVGPAMGYFMGWFVERHIGGAPWPGVIGLMLGLLAAFRQIYLMLVNKGKEVQKEAQKEEKRF